LHQAATAGQGFNGAQEAGCKPDLFHSKTLENGHLIPRRISHEFQRMPKGADLLRKISYNEATLTTGVCRACQVLRAGCFIALIARRAARAG
jgi:hypothetical protein